MVERSAIMSKFDIDEQNIYELLSKINVDSSKLTEQVKKRLHEGNGKYHKKWTKTTVAAIVMSFILAVSATVMAIGNFKWFIEKLNPSFGEIIEPVQSYSEDKGIRMEVIGAQKYDNQAVIYLSLQDVTGQNRLTEHTDFKDGFYANMRPKISDGNDILSSSISWKSTVLYFNENTNTVYYEFLIMADPDSPLADPLELGSSLIYFDEKKYVDEPVSLTANIEELETIPISKEQIWGWGGHKIPNDSLTKVLMPGYYADMPHGEKDQWISAIGVIDGKLHVQIGTMIKKGINGSSDAMLSLKNRDGHNIPFDYSLVFFCDEKNNLLGVENNNFDRAIYKYEEFVFPVKSQKLSEYTLSYTGSVFSGTEGDWKVVSNLNDSTSNMRTWKSNTAIGDYLFEYMTLSPLGLQVIGTYKGENWIDRDLVLEIETIDGMIPLEVGGISQNPDKQTFHSSWMTKEPLDITKVTAIIVNGTRIPVK